MNTVNQLPKISILCPCYNHAPYIRQALDSILMQEVDFPIEILVGEDCSPDNSRAVLQAYEAEHPGVFQMLYREKNMGGTSNFYDLITRASGTYIITLETDDYWTDPHKLQKQADFLDAHPEYIGCAHICEKVDGLGVSQGLLPTGSPQVGQRYTLTDFLRAKPAFQTATLLYRNVFQDGGDYSIIRTAHPLVGDFTVYSILLQRGDIYVMPDCMSVYRQVIKKGSNSFSAQETAHREKMLLLGMQMLVNLEIYFKKKVDYSIRKQDLLNSYLAAWLRRRPGYTTDGLRFLWEHVGGKAHLRAGLFVLGFPFRKLLAHASPRKKEAHHVQ